MTAVSRPLEPMRQASAITAMLADEYERILEAAGPQDPGHRYSRDQLAHAKALARRNVVDRLEARGPISPGSS